MVYHYANELAKRGHDVTVAHAGRLERARSAKEWVKATSWPTRKRLRYGSRPPWFGLDARVRAVLIPDLGARHIPDADAVFATACMTAPVVADYDTSKGEKFYLIQHYEDFLCGKDGVEATWRLPMHKVVVSGWLYGIAMRLGETQHTSHIPNGVETEIFRIEATLEARQPSRIGFLAHEAPSKGMRYAIAAVEKIRQSKPDCEVVAFGVTPRPSNMPDWIQYVHNPGRDALVALYNSLAIFLHTSVTEGWGLTCAEAMACGCALVASDSGGVRDYAHDGVTAAVVAPRDPESLACRALELTANAELRLRLAEAGAASIREFTWDRAANALDALLAGGCVEPARVPRF